MYLIVEQIKNYDNSGNTKSKKGQNTMMGYKPIHCETLKPKNNETETASKVLHQKRKEDIVNELVDPICVISNANEILFAKLGKFLDTETKTYFEMITRATTKTKTLVEELRQETN